MKFSIEQLKLVNELCFPNDFERLLKIYLPDEEKKNAQFHRRAFCRMGCSLITWIFHTSGADDKRTFWGSVNEKIVADLLGEKVDIL
jgi:hypothetical protein